MAEFDQKNHWIIDRGDGTPSVNLVILSFVQPLNLLSKVTDSQTLNGVPIGMTPEVVNYFKSRGVRVMLSIGGITYVKDARSVRDPQKRQPDITRARTILKWEPKISLDEGIHKTIPYFKNKLGLA